MLGGRFGAAGARVVIEEFMDGEEGSLFALCDGDDRDAVRRGPGPQARLRRRPGPQHRRHGDLFAGAGLHAANWSSRRATRLVEPTVAGMAAEGAPYRGVLYAGLMATDDGPKLVEFNARFGDPECQVLMLRLESDLVPYLHGLRHRARWPSCRRRSGATRRRSAWCWPPRAIPTARRPASVIRGADADFGAGRGGLPRRHEARRRRRRCAPAGGRVLNVCARGADPAARPATGPMRPSTPSTGPAASTARDIGWRALG